ncbi:MAG: NAD(P)H-dependent oxidoreductase [Candidatus Latescibacterota bacterium]|nr:MAG: NAD(P)H-dependent oxidoreductase [Candidatus Latescibacterota bacterium]
MNSYKHFAHRVLILFAHPALQKSRVNRVLINAVRKLDGVTVHDLYERYPEFDIDVKYEQGLLLAHDVVVFHHPFFWYSTPAILKEWQDLVLQHGWAYGREGTALRDKVMFNVITTGGSEAAYQKSGHNRITMRELLSPIERTAVLCGMEYLPPFVAHGTLGMQASEIRRHADDYRRIIEAYRDGRVNLKAARRQPRLNANLDKVIQSDQGNR